MSESVKGERHDGKVYFKIDEVGVVRLRRHRGDGPDRGCPTGDTAAAQAEANRVAVNSDDIGGVVTSSKGPEAGVWVIAETTDLPTKFRKIVVTDDAGRYLLPELPKATYKVWVRGYGLVDSKPVEATPGKTLALTAVIAPNCPGRGAILPGRLLVFASEDAAQERLPDEDSRSTMHEAAQERKLKRQLRAIKDTEIQSQAQWAFLLKRGCEVCHQMGNKATREIEPRLGTFDSPALAWERRLMSGQVGPQMTNASIISATIVAWRCSRIGAVGLPRARCRRRRRGRRASSATWSSLCGISVRTGRSSMTSSAPMSGIPRRMPTDRSMAPTFRRARSRFWIRSRTQNP